MLQRNREVRIPRIKSRAAIRKGAGQIAARRHRHVAIKLAVPQHHRDFHRIEIEAPGTGDKAHVFRRTGRPLPTRFFETSHEPTSDLSALEEDAIGFRSPRRHPIARPRATTADGTEIEPEEETKDGRGRAPETEHHPQRTTHRSQKARRIGWSHPAKHTDGTHTVEDERPA